MCSRREEEEERKKKKRRWGKKSGVNRFDVRDKRADNHEDGVHLFHAGICVAHDEMPAPFRIRVVLAPETRIREEQFEADLWCSKGLAT